MMSRRDAPASGSGELLLQEAGANSFVARQAILDRQQRVIAYAILFRSVRFESNDAEPEQAAAQGLADIVLSIGLSRILDGKKGFFRFTRQLLLSKYFSVLPPDATVVDLPETVPPDSDVQECCRILKGRGYALALSGFSPAQLSSPLLQSADFVKVDLKLLHLEEHRCVVKEISRRHLKLVVENVQTEKDFTAARELGYLNFQGTFLARLSVLKVKQPPTLQAANYHHLLRTVNDPDFDFHEIEHVVRREPSLVFKLLRYLNSVHFGWNSRIESIQHGLVLLGIDEVRKWVSLAILTSMGDGKPRALLVTAMLRARFCEQIGVLSGITDRRLKLFLVGMFSIADVILERPMSEIVAEIHLGSDVTAALLETGREDDPVVLVYQLIRAYEAAEWTTVTAIAKELGMSESAVVSVYIEAIRWADEML